jgi:PAS domain S-box-containing protein
MRDLLDRRTCSPRSQEELYPAILEILGIGTAELTLDGNWHAVNQPLCHLLGFSAQELLGTRFGHIFRPVNRGSHEQELHRLRAAEIPMYCSEMVAVRKDGQHLWTKAAFSLVRHMQSQNSGHYVVAVTDISALKRARKALHNSELAREEVARRLIIAQEAERTRIARELHDDIGQSLAVLKIQMLRAGQPVFGKPGQTHPTAPELARKMQDIAGKVSRLSHQLHSSELEFLGLAVAVKSHCREASERYKIAVDCVCSDVPGELNNVLALAFLRVVQEALHNVAKHAAATQVSVQLGRAGNELYLTISDNGAGFDVQQARLSPGLGLISMRERLHLVGGETAVFSTPGQGTVVNARAPLSTPDALPEEGS